MASTHLTFTNGTPTNNAKFTISVWSKRSGLASSDYMNIMNSRQTSSTSGLGLWWGNDSFYYNFGTGVTGTAYCQSTAKYRDVNGWYHMVVAGDTTQSGTDKLKFWINGEQITSFSTDNRSSFVGLDYDIGNTNYPILIGMKHDNTYYYDGSLSHLHFIDGTAYQASDFGSTDSTTGEWKINTNPSVTYGNNGFFILKDGNSVTDQSGNSNNFTVGGGTLTKTEDNPSNVFATLNNLITTPSGLTYSNGNNTITTSGTQWQGTTTTLAPTSGKYYWEAKYNTGSGIKLDIGRLPDDLQFLQTNNTSYLSYSTYGYGYQLNNSGTDYYCSNNTCTTWNASRGNSTKIYMIAVDLDNGKMWIGADGTWFNKSGTANPVTGDDPLHDFSANLNGDPWYFGMSVEGGSGSHNANFGNGYFGTTAVSSAGTNASNIGIFEYDVPAGYTALSTKGINSF